MNRKKTVIITGAGGLVGLTLLTLLDPRRYTIIAIDKKAANLDLAKRINPKITTCCADLSKKEKAWTGRFSKADCVIQSHAEITHHERGPYVKNNITSVRNVVKTCEREKVKHLIHLSSSVVIGISRDNYSTTKIAGERIVRESKVPYTIFRPPLMYGPFDNKHIGGFITKLIDRSPIVPVPGKGDFIRQPLYANDMAKLIIAAMERGPRKKIHDVIGKEKITFLEMLKTVARIKKRKVLFLKVPMPLFGLMIKAYNIVSPKKPYTQAQLAALTAGDVFPVTDWDKEFGVTYTPFAKGMRETIRSRYYGFRKLMER